MSWWERNHKYELSNKSREEFNNFINFYEINDEEIRDNDFDNSDEDVHAPNLIVRSGSHFFLQAFRLSLL